MPLHCLPPECSPFPQDSTRGQGGNPLWGDMAPSSPRSGWGPGLCRPKPGHTHHSLALCALSLWLFCSLSFFTVAALFLLFPSGFFGSFGLAFSFSPAFPPETPIWSLVAASWNKHPNPNLDDQPPRLPPTGDASHSRQSGHIPSLLRTFECLLGHLPQPPRTPLRTAVNGPSFLLLPEQVHHTLPGGLCTSPDSHATRLSLFQISLEGLACHPPPTPQPLALLLSAALLTT